MEMRGKWRYGRDREPYDWWILRRSLAIAKLPKLAVLRITSAGCHTPSGEASPHRTGYESGDLTVNAPAQCRWIRE